jgi:hypothetical protein
MLIEIASFQLLPLFLIRLMNMGLERWSVSGSIFVIPLTPVGFAC